MDLPLPALFLVPLNDSFALPKAIPLAPASASNRVRVGRMTNAKTVPSERNAFFDSKVLSRAHAEIWSENDKIYIKDIKSSNGTFINGDRLSPESVESAVFEIRSADTVEFGIDILNDDNKSVQHQKVSARAYCAFKPDEASRCFREISYYKSQQAAHDHLRKAVANRSTLQVDKMISKLQSDLDLSKQTATQLGNISSSLGDVQESLGGVVPQGMINNLFKASGEEGSEVISFDSATAFSVMQALQRALKETQSALTAQSAQLSELRDVSVSNSSLRADIQRLREDFQSRLSKVESSDEDDSASIITLGRSDRNHLVGESHGAMPDTIPETEQKEPAPQVFAAKEAFDDLRKDMAAHARTMQQSVESTAALEQQINAIQNHVAILENSVRDLHAKQTASEKQAVKSPTSPDHASSQIPIWSKWRLDFEANFRKEKESWAAERKELQELVQQLRTKVYSENDADESPRREDMDGSDGEQDLLVPSENDPSHRHFSSSDATLVQSLPGPRTRQKLRKRKGGHSRKPSAKSTAAVVSDSSAAEKHLGPGTNDEHGKIVEEPPKDSPSVGLTFGSQNIPILSAAGAIFLSVAVYCVFLKVRS